MLRSRHRHVIGPKHVVLDGFESVRLHHWDVFVGGCVINNRRRVLVQNLIEASAILDATNLGVERSVWVGMAHLAIELEQGGLGDFEPDDAGSAETDDLAAQFRTDGTAGTGYEHDFALNRGADPVFFKAYGVAAE